MADRPVDGQKLPAGQGVGITKDMDGQNVPFGQAAGIPVPARSRKKNARTRNPVQQRNQALTITSQKTRKKNGKNDEEEEQTYPVNKTIPRDNQSAERNL